MSPSLKLHSIANPNTVTLTGQALYIRCFISSAHPCEEAFISSLQVKKLRPGEGKWVRTRSLNPHAPASPSQVRWSPGLVHTGTGLSSSPEDPGKQRLGRGASHPALRLLRPQPGSWGLRPSTFQGWRRAAC